ncbi:YdcF family protein [Dietzia sp. ANT_WB102]|uniref:YdcF family protein n=1 Tax=Dietzia sp. ANT_WB102 TaxID=2597345 RepID=UPI0011EFFC51|nr:YdcF family protein [Dietzia sp. ANT_WB102]KAA0919000.1 YdcF family protein [Dietzia sp. ANT_WB102]
MTHTPLHRTVLSATAVLIAGALTLTAWGAFLLQPRADEPVRADAVVMLAGADDGRHLYARDLVEAGYAETLLVSNPGGNSETVARRLCTGVSRPADAEVVCFSPDPRTTWGEAQTIAAIARTRGWERILVVTNRPHTLRAGTWMRNATGLDVRMTPIERVDRTMLPVHLVWEIAGWVKGRINGYW